jgi:Tfp pilus assembly protein PilF
MFTVRLRLAYLLHEQDPATAISLYGEVLQIDPLRLDVNELMGEAYVIQAEHAKSATDASTAYQNAINAFKAEVSLSPVTAQFTALTGDKANNAHAHWALAEVYEKLGQKSDAVSELNLYLEATQWHSDVYPWRIILAQRKIEELSGSSAPRVRRGR